jgi:serine/threonine-protein kinase
MSDAAPDPFLGQVLDGKYRILERIGSGGMGTVYRALHLTLGAPRAAKLMRSELAADPGFIQRFRHEARLVESLRHPNLVALHDFGQLPDGTWYIVSELVEGETLAAAVRRGSHPSPAEVADLIGQVADGLALAHRKGIVHRDLSPDNVMVTRDDAGRAVAKLLDFGVAKSADGGSARTGSGLVLGKIGYASPEQMGLLAPGEDLDARSDVFSLAVVALHLLSGRLPWRSDSLQSYVHDLIVRPEAVTREAIAALAPPPWVEPLLRGTARQRAARTADVLTLKAELREAAAAPPGAPTPTVVPVTARRQMKGLAASRPAHRRLLVGAVLVAAVAVAGGVAFVAGRGTPAPPTPPPPTRSSTAPPLPPASLPPTTIAAVPAPVPRPAPSAVRPFPDARRVVAAQAPPTTVPPAVPSPTPTPAGRLVVESEPAASVRLQGEPRGRTPLTLPALPAGSYRLSLTTDDGRTYEEQVQVEAGDTVRRAHRFAGFGALTVASDVWLNVTVDDGPAQQTPCRFDRLVAGRHRVRASRPGYRERVLEVDVAEGETKALRVALEP